MSPILVIGVGNEFRCDDAVGLLVARELRQRLAKAAAPIAVQEHSGEGSRLMSAWEQCPWVVLVDAVSAEGGQAGDIVRCEAGAGSAPPLPAAGFRCSSHAFGVTAAIELSRAMGSLPPRLVLYGVVGRRFTHGLEPTPEVLTAVGRVTDRVLIELRDNAAPAAEPRRA